MLEKLLQIDIMMVLPEIMLILGEFITDKI
jgi:hypothetical protein